MKNTKSNAPLVSVVILNYNMKGLIKETLDSVFASDVGQN